MKETLRRAVVATLRAGLNLSGEKGRRVTAEALALNREPLLELIETVALPQGDMKFYCIGELALWRARTALSKEPETIEWIDGFAEGDVLWDIGANVGIYSIYAAVARRARVLAFEPSASNYLLLNRNIEINRLSDQISAYCLAISGASGIAELNMLSTEFGGAMSTFGAPIDYEGQEFTPNFRQSMIGFTIDDFIERFSPPFPTHIKIDVDGLEGQIIEGGHQTFGDPRLRSLSIELMEDRPDSSESVIETLANFGFSLHSKRHADMLDGGRFDHVYNYRFERDA